MQVGMIILQPHFVEFVSLSGQRIRFQTSHPDFIVDIFQEYKNDNLVLVQIIVIEFLTVQFWLT